MEAAERQLAAAVSVEAENTRLATENAQLKAKLRMLANVLSSGTVGSPVHYNV